VLLNGSSGIAVGFATNILNRNPVDLVDACLRVLAGKEVGSLLPWWNDYSGPVSQVEMSNQYVMRGVYRVANTTTVEISELPPSITFQKYEAHLNSLQDRGIIQSYEDNSSNGINYTLKFTRTVLADLIAKGKLDQTLKMVETETENITCLDERGKLIVFNNVPQLVEYFTKFRLSFYSKRKEFLLRKYATELQYLSNRARFVKLIIDGKLKINNRPKAELIADLEKLAFDQVSGSFNYLLSMPIHSLTKETYEQLMKEVGAKEEELEKIKGREPLDMYKEDLLELKKNLKTASKR